MGDQTRIGEPPVERGVAEETAEAPLTEAEIKTSRRAPSDRGDEAWADADADADSPGMATGFAGGTGSGSGMVGHPDAGK